MITTLILTVVGAIIYAVIGTLWYSMGTPMGKVHMQYLGFDKMTPDEQKRKMEEGKSMMMRMYMAQMFLSLFTSFAVVYVVTLSLQQGLTLWVALGFVVFNWICFMVPVIGTQILWSNCDPKLAWKKFFSDILSNLVTVLVIGYVASFFA